MLAFDLDRIGYLDAFALQERVLAWVQAGGDDVLLVLEHPPTVSIGKNSGAENVPPIWNPCARAMWTWCRAPEAAT